VFKKKTQAVATNGTGMVSGRPLVLYLWPVLVFALIALAGIVLVAQQTLSQRTAAADARAARIVAESLAARIEGEIEARRNLLLLSLADGAAAQALAARDRDRIAAVQRRIEQGLAGIRQVRLLTPDVAQPDPTGAAPMGYAGLDMARRTREAARPVAAEVHQIKSGAPYLALAMPVMHEGGTAGVLFSAWDLGRVVSPVADAPRFAGSLRLVQGDDGAYVVARGPGDAEGIAPQDTVAVPGSIWRIGYTVDSRASGLDYVLYGGVGVAALVLLVLTWLQARSLAGDLRKDMGTLVGLAESIQRRDGGGVAGHAHVRDTSAAIALLAQYARDARQMGAGSPAPVAPVVATPRPAPAPVGNGMATPGVGVEVEELDDDPAELLTGRGAPVGGGDVPAALFRAYDIRGLVDAGLDAGFGELLGRGVGSLVMESGGRRVAVARDSRRSSPQLAAALVRGLTRAGCDVLDIGEAPTPLLYFTLHEQPVEAGVMVTGSHNPVDYNGFKIVIGDRVLDGDELLALRQRMLEGRFSEGNGGVERLDMGGDYIDAVMREVQLARPLKVVIDAGNGVAGELARTTLETLGCEVVPLFCEPDGSFPNHHPDPSQPENVASLMLEVQAQQAGIGLAFDGDGDRLGVVDSEGGNVWPDAVLMMLAGDILGRHPGVDILYDVKSSRHLAAFTLSHGGRPIMWRSGHSRMRAKMQETGALLGGEFTGHFFIKDRWYGFDDAIYAAVRVLELLALDARPSSEVFAELPSSPATPEYHLALAEGQSADLMRALNAHKVFDDARLVELDGLRVEFANGWGLVRPSNTTPALTFRFEADDEQALEQIKGRFRQLLGRIAPDMQAPF
jgi:phosphomannomutase/phosphoglucomutase